MKFRGFGESKFEYSFTIPSLKGTLKEPINSLSSILISIIAIVHGSFENDIVIEKARLLLIINGLAAFFMHAFLPTKQENSALFLIASMDYSSMLTIIACGYVKMFDLSINIEYFFVVTTFMSFFYKGYLWDQLTDYIFGISWCLIVLIMYWKGVYDERLYDSILFGVLGVVCQILDDDLTISRYRCIVTLRRILPLHTLWHIFSCLSAIIQMDLLHEYI